MKKQYAKLVQVLNDNNLTKVSFSDKDKTYTIERTATVQVASSTPSNATTSKAVVIDGTPIKAPIIGSFYEAPAPGKKPFVKVGDKVKKGQVLFILEAMKVMNEIKAPEAGVITAINYKDGDLVEFDEVIMIIR